MAAQPWWKRLFGRVTQRRDVPERIDEPLVPSSGTRVELIAEQLSADVYRHQVQTTNGSVGCWTYVSNGLRRHNQSEIVFTLVHQSGETAAPDPPFALFRSIHERAGAGQIVPVGGHVVFPDNRFFDRHVAFIAAPRMRDVAIPEDAICALLLTLEEVLAVQDFGIPRVMARLGNAARYFPRPHWSDRSRPGIAFDETKRQTLLVRAPRMHLPRCGVYLLDNEVGVLFAAGSSQVLTQHIAQLPENSVFSILTAFDPNADACFVWEPRQSGPVAISLPGSTGRRICGCFLTFSVGLQEDGVVQVEDGFVALLTHDSWRSLRDAVTHERGIRIPPTHANKALVVHCGGEAYHNPIDGKDYVASGGWHLYSGPKQHHAASSFAKHATIQLIRLLTAEKDIEARTTVKDLAQFCNNIHRNVETILGTAGSSTSMFNADVRRTDTKCR